MAGRRAKRYMPDEVMAALIALCLAHVRHEQVGVVRKLRARYRSLYAKHGVRRPR